MLGFPNWIILLVVAALAAGSATYVTREVYTGKIAKIELAHSTALSKQADDANKQLVASKDEALNKERLMTADNSRLESENAKLLGQLTGARLANGRLVDASCGLFDRNGRPATGGTGGGDVMPGSPAAALSAQGRPTTCDIPIQVLSAIRKFGNGIADLLLEADQDAVLAGTGIGYAGSVEKFLGKYTLESAPR